MFALYVDVESVGVSKMSNGSKYGEWSAPGWIWVKQLLRLKDIIIIIIVMNP